MKDAGYQCGEFGDQLDGVDGVIGKVTENSIKAFQKAKGLQATGIIDKETLKALKEANKKTIKLEGNIDDLVKGVFNGKISLDRATKNPKKGIEVVEI